MTRALAIAALLLVSCEARQPGPVETALATQLKRRVTVGGRGDVNPLPATPELVARGREDFSHYCMVCHGLDGQATGVPFAAKMSPPVPKLGSPEVQAYSDGQLHAVIENGLFPSGMPAARGILGDEEIWRIVLYLRHLPPEGSLGEPRVYSEEVTGAASPSAHGSAAAVPRGPAPDRTAGRAAVSPRR